MTATKQPTFWQRLAKVQNTLHVAKTQVNTHMRFNYRSTSDILQEVKPLLEAENLMLTMHDEIEFIGNQNYVKAIVTIIDIDGTEQLTATAYAREDETRPGLSKAQCTGASSTYARKYALAGLFAIDDSEGDPDRDSGKQPISYKCQNEQQALAMIQAATDLKTLIEIHKANPTMVAAGSVVLQALTAKKQQL